MTKIFRKQNFVSLYLLTFCGLALLSGCGSPETASVTSRDPAEVFATDDSTVSLQSMNPIFYAYNYDTANPNILIPVNRVLELNQFEAVLGPQLSLDKLTAQSVITGIGIDVKDLQGNPLAVRLGVIAREFDPISGRFTNHIRTFSAPGVTFENSQTFPPGAENYLSNQIINAPLMTGVGIKVFEANISNLVVQRKAINQLGKTVAAPQAGNYVGLDVNWAAIGFRIRIAKSANSTIYPFPSDVVIYSALYQ